MIHRANVTTRSNPTVQLTTTTQTHLTNGSELAMEMTAYVSLSTYGNVSLRSTDGVGISVKTEPSKLAQAVVDYVSGAKWTDDSRVSLMLQTLDDLDRVIRETRETLQAKAAKL